MDGWMGRLPQLLNSPRSSSAILAGTLNGIAHMAGGKQVVVATDHVVEQVLSRSILGLEKGRHWPSNGCLGQS